MRSVNRKTAVIIAVAAVLAVSAAGMYLAQTLQGTVFRDAIPDWAGESIMELNRRQIIRGYDDGRFGAADSLTRGQVVTLLYRLLTTNGTVAPPGACEPVFADVPDHHYAFAPVCALLQRGWLAAGTKFGPDDIMTRGETAELIRRVLASEISGSDDPAEAARAFRDVQASHGRGRAIAYMKNTGIMAGNPDGTFAPDAPLNRAQAAVILHRAFKLLKGESLHASSSDDVAQKVQVQLIVPEDIRENVRKVMRISGGDLSELSTVLGGHRIVAVVRLEPSEVRFPTPVGILLTFPHEPGTVPLLAHLSGEKLEILEYVVLDKNDRQGTIMLLAAVEHFSDIAIIPVSPATRTSMARRFLAQVTHMRVEELHVQIAQLQVMIAGLQVRLAEVKGGLGDSRSTVSYTFSQTLRSVDLSIDATQLQKFIENDAAVKDANVIQGSAGYFGPMTRSSVIKLQNYGSDIITPIGLTEGTGFFGPKTRSALCTMAVAPSFCSGDEHAAASSAVSSERTTRTPSLNTSGCRETVGECDKIERECEEILDDAETFRVSCSPDDRDCAEEVIDLREQLKSCEKKESKCTERQKYKDCFRDSASSVPDVRRIPPATDATLSSGSSSSWPSSFVSSSAERSSSSSSVKETATAPLSGDEDFLCCEACPGTDIFRFYMPLEGNNCNAGDVERPDLTTPDACSPPPLENMPANFDLPSTFGERCAQKPLGSFEFLDINTGWEPVNDLPFGRQVHFIVASDGSHDVRKDLPIKIAIWVNDTLTYGLTFGGDPTQVCRGADGCSVDGPTIPQDWQSKTVRVEAYGNDGTFLSRFVHKP